MASSQFALNLRSMNCEVVQEQIADVVETLAQRTDELAILLSKAITQEVRPYQVPFDVVARGCAANMRPLSAIAARRNSTRGPRPSWERSAPVTACPCHR